jgi:addiction module HigA family antidote
MMQMHNPPHPGEILKELCLEPLGISITRAAQALGVSRKTLSAILNGRSGISPERCGCQSLLIHLPRAG